MATGNPEEESFTFVDKRRVVADTPQAAPAFTAQEEVPAQQPFGGFATDFAEDESDEVADARVADREEFGGLATDYESDLDGESSDPLGSYGLAAYVTGLIASDAWQKMGLIADPSTGKLAKDLDQARFSIDCTAAIIGVIEQNPSSVPAELRRDLQRVLNDLRLNFVEQSKR